MNRRGHYGIGVEHSKNSINIGTLFRSADIMGASYIFTVGKRYRKQCSDVLKSWRHMPLFHYKDMDALYEAIPFSSLLVGVELVESATPIREYRHPERAVYLLGAEDHGLTKAAVTRCHQLVRLPGSRSLNVSTAGSIVMFDRLQKGRP